MGAPIEDVVRSLVDPEEYKAGMRSLAGAVNIVTSMYAGRRCGMTATAVCSVSVAPPTLLVCVNRNANTHRAIENSEAFCVNVLRAEQSALSVAFSGSKSGAVRFLSGEWSQLRTGSPVLTHSLVSLDCHVARKLEHGTHTIFLGAVAQILVGKKGKPLLYVEGKHARIAPPSLFSFLS